MESIKIRRNHYIAGFIICILLGLALLWSSQNIWNELRTECPTNVTTENHVQIPSNLLIPPPAVDQRRGRLYPFHSYSQWNQDRHMNDNVFKNLTKGFFIEAGAFDGISLSNTLFYEESLDWTGLLVEPDPTKFQQMIALKRNAWLFNGCLASDRFKKQEIILREAGSALGYLEDLGDQHRLSVNVETSVTVQCYPLNALLDTIGVRHVNYFSLDVEGAEAAVLHSIDFQRFSFDVIDTECNYCVDGTGKWKNEAGEELNEKRGYVKQLLKMEGYEEKYYIEQDIVYINKNFTL